MREEESNGQLVGDVLRPVSRYGHLKARNTGRGKERGHNRERPGIGDHVQKTTSGSVNVSKDIVGFQCSVFF